MVKFPLKCTKIVSTIGPSITLKMNSTSAREKINPDYVEVLELFTSLFYKGLNCVRFNFSHSNNEERLFRLSLLREAKSEFHKNFNRVDEKGNSPQKLRFVLPISECCDTKGPEIRVCSMKVMDQGQLYKRGQIVKIHCINNWLGDETAFSVTDSTGKYNMALDCHAGEKILVDDGKLSLLIQSVEVDNGIVEVLVENDHYLKANKRVNLPNADYSLPFLSEKDKNDILFSLKEGFESIALSFVNKKEDVLEVKRLIADNLSPNKKSPLIISKVETSQCLKNIDSIISVSDGIMIARGDLALESPYYEVPYWTKEILKKSAKQGKPVIVATQMLDSLERSVVPTRAEVADVYRAAELSTDCTMLSGETAQGLFPLVAVSTMSQIVQSSEKKCNYEKLYEHFIKECKIPRLLHIGNSLYQSRDQFDGMIACFLFEDSVLEEEIFPLSKLKFPFPFVVFSRQKSYALAEEYANSKFSSLYRGLYRISVLNLLDESLEECSRTFLSLCGYTKLPEKVQLIALYEGNAIRIIPF